MKKTAMTVADGMGVDIKPTITLTKDMYSGLDKLKVDDMVDLNLKVKINRVSKDQFNGGKLEVSGIIQNASPEEDDHED